MIIVLFVIVVVAAAVVVAVVGVEVESSSGSSGRGVEVLSSRNGKNINNDSSTKNSSRVVKVLRCKHSPVALCVMK